MKCQNDKYTNIQVYQNAFHGGIWMIKILPLPKIDLVKQKLAGD